MAPRQLPCVQNQNHRYRGNNINARATQAIRPLLERPQKHGQRLGVRIRGLGDGVRRRQRGVRLRGGGSSGCTELRHLACDW